jgi:hypothetical protein
MSAAVVPDSATQRAVARLRAAVDAVRELDMASLADDELIDTLREIEVEKRRLATADQALLAQIEARHLGVELGCRDTTTLVGHALRIDPHEARARMRAAEDLGPRQSLTGEPLGPMFPLVAGAVGEGAISPAVAGIVTRALDALPADVQAERGTEIEQTLVAHARTFAPRELRIIVRRLRETYDQDGRLAHDEDRARRRHLEVHQHADGTVSGSFLLDPVAGEALLTVIDALGKPEPAENGAKDPRTAGQRRHDALRAALLTALRTGGLPASGGVTTTIVLTMTLEQFKQLECAETKQDRRSGGQRARAPGDGLVRTGHGALMSLREAGPLSGDAQLQAVVLDGLRRVCAYGATHRLFTRGQRLAMIARDHGCSFPGCTVPAAWCEAHHVVGFVLGGPTSVENGTLLCGHHHRMFERLGYHCVMIDGIPHWIPPRWIDREGTPRRNTAHDPA